VLVVAALTVSVMERQLVQPPRASARQMTSVKKIVLPMPIVVLVCFAPTIQTS
jgi:hypothetical protein